MVSEGVSAVITIDCALLLARDFDRRAQISYSIKELAKV
jgi:hypothetical protein